LNAELYSAYLYLSMSAYFASAELAGFADWMRVQTREELVHAMKFFDYMNERGGRVVLGAVADPPMEWTSPLDAFESAYRHEQKVTGLIGGLVNVAEQEKDTAAKEFLQWYVKEQEEEEESAAGVVAKLKAAAGDSAKMMALDCELGKRTFHPPSA